MENKTDILTKEDIKSMVDAFYAKVNKDALLSPVFNEYAKVDWDAHLPKMYGFWSNVVFASGEYKGNAFRVHVPLPIEKKHFAQWLHLFHNTVDEMFAGANAEMVKHRATTIGFIFQSKLEHLAKDE